VPRSLKETPVIDLYLVRRKSEAKRLYSLYLSTLLLHGRWARAVRACTEIRRIASRHHNLALGNFTYAFEIQGLCSFGHFRAAWRRLRQLERFALGRPINLRAKKWNTGELQWFASYHVQILFFLGRYKLAARLLEAVLAQRMRLASQRSTNALLPYVCNRLRKPRRCFEVTLEHLYQKLGRSLREWKQWNDFLTRLDDELFQSSRISRHHLSQDPKLLRRLSRTYLNEQSAFSGLSDNRTALRKGDANHGVNGALREFFPDLVRGAMP
jgi:hypothetical protein